MFDQFVQHRNAHHQVIIEGYRVNNCDEKPNNATRLYKKKAKTLGIVNEGNYLMDSCRAFYANTTKIVDDKMLCTHVRFSLFVYY